ncbi:MAG: TonB-dependent receptor plug domain-containing protein, partial [Thermodesulfovibrionales bacterium]|nr:TonB-dependent receptor plug domain-containing protein [Thermodesulfovibrionales bacterium]
MERKFLFCLIVLSFLLLTQATAQESQLQELEVVSSPIIEDIRVTNQAVQITTVTDKQIEAMNAFDLPSALRRVPGITITRYNLVGSYGGAAGGAIYIRGMGAERPGAEIQTLIDGRPVFQGIFTHPLMDLLSIDNVERIEIYKNPQPVTLGNMSYGAVNLITKRKTTDGFETRAGLTYGEHNTLISYINHGGKKDGWDYYLIADYKKSDGHRKNADGELQNYFVRVGRELSKEWDVTLTALYTDNWAQDPGVVNRPLPPVIPRFASRSTAFDLTASNNYQNAKGFIKLYFEEGAVRWRQYDTSAQHAFFSNTDWKTWGLKVEERFSLWKGGELTAGYDYLRYGGSFQEIRPTRITSLDKTYFYNSAPYASISHTFETQNIQIIPSVGVRYNMSKEFDDDIGWQSGIVMRYKDTELHARYARGFNLPGVYAVFQYTKMWNQGAKWKSLKPELINHYEIGLSHLFRDWLKATVTLFWNYGKDRFIFKSPPPR